MERRLQVTLLFQELQKSYKRYWRKMRTNLEQEAHNIIEFNTKDGHLNEDEVRKDLEIIADQPLTLYEREVFNTAFARAYIQAMREEMKV